MDSLNFGSWKHASNYIGKQIYFSQTRLPKILAKNCFANVSVNNCVMSKNSSLYIIVTAHWVLLLAYNNPLLILMSTHMCCICGGLKILCNTSFIIKLLLSRNNIIFVYKISSNSKNKFCNYY